VTEERFDRSQRDVIKVFVKKWPNITCQVCKSQKWLWMDGTWKLPSFYIAGDPVLPLIALMCDVCGNTLLFNAVANGAVQKQDDN